MLFTSSLPSPVELKTLRESANIDLVNLAKRTSLSIAQLNQLEQGGDNLFYSQEIKQQAIKRVLKVVDPFDSYSNVLGRTLPLDQAFEVSPSKETQTPTQDKDVIGEIVRLSSKSRNSFNLLPSSSNARKSLSPMAWGAICVMVGILVLYWSPWDAPSSEQVTDVLLPVSPALLPSANNPSLSSAPSPSPSPFPITSMTGAPSSATNPAPTSLEKDKAGELTASAALGMRAAGLRAAELSSSLIDAMGMAEGSKKNKSADTNNASANTSSNSSTNLNSNANPGLNEKISTSAESLPKPSGGALKVPESQNPGVSTAAKTGEQFVADPCQLLTSDPPTATTLYPTKAGNYVYLTSSDDFEACVQDALGKKTPVRLNKDQGMSVYGKSPWQIVSPNLQKIQIYFQGARVNTALISGQTVQLVEQSIN